MRNEIPGIKNKKQVNPGKSGTAKKIGRCY